LNTPAPDRTIAAWPALLGVQVVALLVVGLAGWWLSAADSQDAPTIEQRLQTLDVTSAAAAVEYSLDQVQDDAALLENDVVRVTSFLALAARGADLSVLDIRLAPLEQQQEPGVEVVEAILDVSGHLFDLPIFLDGAHRQRAVGRLQSMAFEVQPGGSMHGQVRFHYFRPHPGQTEWIAGEVSSVAPSSEEAVSVLKRAAELAAWQAFREGQSERSELAHHARSRAAVELPANLIALKASGGRFVWDADDGIVIR